MFPQGCRHRTPPETHHHPPPTHDARGGYGAADVTVVVGIRHGDPMQKNRLPPGGGCASTYNNPGHGITPH